MTTKVSAAVPASRKAVYDRIESQIRILEEVVATLRAKAESARAAAELKAIDNLSTAKKTLDEKVADLKRAGETAFERVKADVEARVAEFDKSLHAIASKINAR